VAVDVSEGARFEVLTAVLLRFAEVSFLGSDAKVFAEWFPVFGTSISALLN
jgi:hypothetical protein